ncbi:MAG: DNA repair protein RecO [Candidatus Saccharimonadales bacterium]
MTQVVTNAIVLSRTNYQEADRIITFLTSDNGKVRGLAKGVRRSRAKLAGGIEPLSINEIGFIKGRSELCTLTSARLQQHFGNIVSNMDRTMRAYALLKRINSVTEDNSGNEYFELASQTLKALDDPETDMLLIELWFDSQLLDISGHTPNLTHDRKDTPLKAGTRYMFDLESMIFDEHPEGNFSSTHIKLLRLVRTHSLVSLERISGIEDFVQPCLQLVSTMRKNYLHV